MKTGMNTLQTSYKIYSYTLPVSSAVAMLSAVLRWLWRTDSSCVFDWTTYVQLSQKLDQCLSFAIFIVNFFASF